MITVSSSAVNKDEKTFPAVSIAGDSRADKDLISKIHLHLSHLNKGGLRRMLVSAGYQFEEKDLDAVLAECECVDPNPNVQRTLISEYIPEFFGHAVCRCVLPH